jgi:uncharacterized delta-60 repeat protein
LVVLGLPEILSQPDSISMPVGSNLVFNLNVRGIQPLVFQWYRDGIALSNGGGVSGAISNYLRITNILMSQAGNYTLVVTNALGAVTSSVATVNLYLLPSGLYSGFTNSPGVDNSIYSLARLPDGRLLMAGEFYTAYPGAASRTRIALLNTNYTVSTALTHSASSSIYELLAQPDGKVLVGGNFTSMGTVTNRYLLRMNADFTFDNAFNLNLGVGPSGTIYDLETQPDGKILVAGSFTFIGTHATTNIGRLNPDGTVDRSFSGTANSPVNKVKVARDGRILLAGQFYQYGGADAYYIARLNTNGVRDTNFIVRLDGHGKDLAEQPDGKILVGGAFYAVNSVSRRSLARLNPNGTLDTNFLGTTSINGEVSSLALQMDGKIVAGGNFSTIGTKAVVRLARFNPDGTLDNVFNTGSGFNGNMAPIQLEPDGRIWVGGGFNTYSGVSVKGLVLLNGNAVGMAFALQPVNLEVNPGVTAQFFSLGVGTNAISYQWLRNGTNLANNAKFEGANTAVLSISNVAKVDEAGYSVVITSASGSLTSVVASLSVLGAPELFTQPESRTLAAGTSLLYNLSARAAAPVNYRWYRNGNLLTNGGSISGATNLIFVVSNLTTNDTGNYEMVVSNAFGMVTSATAYVVVYLPPAGRWSGFASNGGAGNLSVYAAATLTNGSLILGGTFTQVYTPLSSRACLVMLGTNGSPASSFTNSANSTVYDVVVQPDGKFLVGGAFTSIAGTTNRYLVRFNADGIFDTNFSLAIGTGPNSSLEDIELQPDGKILVCGWFTAINGLANTAYIARLNLDGSVDTNFVATTHTAPTEMRYLPDNKIITVGYFTNIGSGPVQSYVARLNYDGTRDTNFACTVSALVYDVAIQSDGKLLIAGDFSTVNGYYRAALARLNANGTLDTNFLNGVSLTAGSVFDVAVQSNGKIVIGGSFTFIGGNTVYRLARLNTDGTVDGLFNSGVGPNGLVRRIHIDSNGHIWAVGDFTQYNGASVYRMVALNGEAPVNPNSFDGWRVIQPFPTGLDGAAHDPDNDGTPNIVEYALGGNPLANAPLNFPASTTVVDVSTNYPALNIVRRKNMTGAAIQVDAAYDLGFTQPVGTTLMPAIIDLGNGTEQIVIRANIPQSGATVIFFRTRVLVTP